MKQVKPAAPTGHETYDDAYFAAQRAKSDAKVGWEYDRLLTLGGVGFTAASRVLDAACGAAPGLRAFARRGVRAVGADIAPAALTAAHDLLPDAPLVRADLDAPLPFAADTFALIVLREAIEHVRDGQTTLRECLRVLAPGGCVALTTPNRWDMRRPVYRARGKAWSGEADPSHTHIYSPREMGALLRALGFARVRVRTGFKPLVRFGGRRLPVQFALPYPPLVGNGVVAFAWKGDA